MATQDKKNRLTKFFDVRNTILEFDKLNDVVDTSLRLVREKIETQTAAIFLCTKEGLVKRVGITGIDKKGKTVDNNWFIEEEHEKGKSFTGKVFELRNNSKYGEPQWSNNLSNDATMDAKSRNAYLNKLGILKCAIAVPLNGCHCTYGALEAINKIDKNGKVIRGGEFSNEEVYWLSMIGMSIATAISGLRRKYELDMLSNISKLIVEPQNKNYNGSSFYKTVVEKLISPTMPYKACIIRIEKNNKLAIVATGGDCVIWEDRTDEPVQIGDRIVGQVFETGEHEIMAEIKLKEGNFLNIKWVHKNDFKSYVCIPLSVKGNIVGTLSLFTGYQHDFNDNDIAFLNNIGFLVATFTERIRLTQELQKVKKESKSIRENILSSTRVVVYDQSVEGLMHTTKNEFNNILYSLTELKNARASRQSQILKENIHWIEKRVLQLTEELSQQCKSFSQVDINNLVKDVVKFFSLELEGDNIYFNQRLNREIPDIEANRDEIKEIIINLISNAVKAIQKKKATEGFVEIETNIVESAGIVYIQISVDDSGVGIKNEESKLIFQKGYSTYEGGTGMGLFIICRILEKYGGKIDFNSTVGVGSVFFVKFPLERLKW